MVTHIHNGYVTGGLALAQRTGADYLVNGEDDVSFDRTPVSDGECEGRTAPRRMCPNADYWLLGSRSRAV